MRENDAYLRNVLRSGQTADSILTKLEGFARSYKNEKHSQLVHRNVYDTYKLNLKKNNFYTHKIQLKSLSEKNIFFSNHQYLSVTNNFSPRCCPKKITFSKLLFIIYTKRKHKFLLVVFITVDSYRHLVDNRYGKS